MDKYDVVVIGAGNGGLGAACRILNAGKTAWYAKSTTYRVDLPRVSYAADSSSKPRFTNSTVSGPTKSRGARANFLKNSGSLTK